MCFYIHKDHNEVKIADKDIVCYKTLDRYFNAKKGIFYSPIQEYVYNFNKKTLYKVKRFEIWFSSIEQGLHSYSTRVEARNGWGNEIFKCVIPKGTKYYYNPFNNEYVSLALEFKERITFKSGRIK